MKVYQHNLPEEFMKATKLREKYDVTVINVPLDAEVSTYCVCGHHVSKHEGHGTAGKCTECAKTLPDIVVRQTVHNFHPRKWRRTHKESDGSG